MEIHNFSARTVRNRVLLRITVTIMPLPLEIANMLQPLLFADTEEMTPLETQGLFAIVGSRLVGLHGKGLARDQCRPALAVHTTPR